VVLGAFCAAVFVGGHLIQELRDLSGDRRSAIRTNAVAFGATRTFFAGLACFFLSHAILLALALSGMLPRPLAAVSVLFALHLHWSFEALRDGLTRPAVCRLQARYRGLYALVGIVVAVTVWLA
jgi:4-hydroxybenzoate polyprenyltransferase